MIYILPGMGASSSMYAREWKNLRGFTYVDWPEGFDEVSITALARTVIADYSIGSDDVVIGSSLGGIVACEIANLIEVQLVVLIGGAKCQEEISRILQILHPLIDYSPISFVKHAVGKVPMELAQGLIDSDAKFIRNMCKAIFKWEGYTGATELFRVHGTKDRVIPLPDGVDAVLDGGHLIALTHPNECVQAIKIHLKGES